MLNKYQRRSVPGIKAVNLFALQHIKKGLLLSSAVCQEKAEENPVWLVTKGPQLTSRASGFYILIITLSLEVIIKKYCSWTSSTEYCGTRKLKSTLKTLSFLRWSNVWCRNLSLDFDSRQEILQL